MTHPGHFGTEFTIRIDPVITTADERATLSDVRRLHRFEDDGLTGDGVTVAVTDTGIDPTHPVFESVDVEYHDFTGTSDTPDDRIGHGTAVSGLIVQLAPDVDIVALRMFGTSGSADTRAIFDAYQWLIDHADEMDLVNMSWGARRKVEQIDAIHNRMVAQGIRDVVSAGNTGGRGGSPATAERAFSAGAVTEDGEVTRFNSYDPRHDNPDVSALGKNVLLPRATGTSMGRVVDTPDRDGEYVVASGTSFSAPIDAAAVARWWERHGDGVEAVVPAFERTAIEIPGTPREGAGMLDYAAAVDRGAPRSPTAIPATVGSPAGLDRDWVQVEADVLPDGEYTVDPEQLRRAFCSPSNR